MTTEQEILRCEQNAILWLENINKTYAQYVSNPKYVYKYVNVDGTEWIIILEKIAGTEPTKTNESRKVVDKMYAKYRANKLLTKVIFSKNDPSITTNEITNPSFCIFTCRWPALTYRVDEIAYPDNFCENLDIVCASGIHYYRSIEAVYHHTILYHGIYPKYGVNGEEFNVMLRKYNGRDRKDDNKTIVVSHDTYIAYGMAIGFIILGVIFSK